jgi:hypothetical protein
LGGLGEVHIAVVLASLVLTHLVEVFVAEAFSLKIFYWLFTWRSIPVRKLARMCLYSLAVSPVYLVSWDVRLGILGNIALSFYYVFGLIAMSPERKIAAMAA